MKKLLILTIIILLFLSNIFAQAPDTLWTKTFGGNGQDGGHSVQQTTDGGFIIAGGTYSFGAGDKDVWLIKTDFSGDTLWTKTFGGTNRDDGYSVQQTTDGGYIITGSTESFGAGDSDVWLIKTNASGDTLWTKTFGGINDDVGSSVEQTTDGGYIICGHTRSFGAGFDDIWLIKTDISGDTLWTKTIGGRFQDRGRSVQQTSDGGYIIIGDKYLHWISDGDVWLIKTGASGDTLWTKTFVGSNVDHGSSVKQTTDGGYIVTGVKDEGYSGGDVWLIKTEASGDTLWTKTYGYDGWGISVQQTIDGGYIITGAIWDFYFGAGHYDFLLIKTDVSGDTLWTKTLGGEDYDWGISIMQTVDSGYIITGVKNWDFNDGGDVWLIKIATDPTHLIKGGNTVVSEYQLSQNYPNPFNPSTKIEYNLPKSEIIKIEIFNLLGQKIKTLLNKQMPSGSHEIEFTAKDLPSGVYLYRIEAGEFQEVRKMVLLK